MNVPLPVELVTAILNETDAKVDLLSLRATCRLFHDVATPLVFRVLGISQISVKKDSIMELIETPEVSKYVQEINLIAVLGNWGFADSDNENDSDEAIQEEFSDERIEEISVIFSNLASFPNLKRLRLYFPNEYLEEPTWADYEPTTTRRLQVSIFEAIARAPPVPSLEIFEIYNLIPLPNGGSQHPGFATFLKSLKTLYLQIVSERGCEGYSDDRFTEFYEKDVPIFLKSPSQMLTSLSLINNFRHNNMPNSFWDTTLYPNLKHLHIRDLVFLHCHFLGNSQNDIEIFILWHKASLTTIKLSKCTIDIGHNQPNPLSPVRAWADIWMNVERELPRLTEFIFDPLSGRNEKETDLYNGYTYLDPRWGYLNISDDSGLEIPSESRDRQAWEGLQDTIRRRNENNHSG